MTELPKEHHEAVVDQAEVLVDRIRHLAQIVMNGLADRPKPHAKTKAREAMREIIAMNGELWRFIEGKKPYVIVLSNL